MKGRSERKAEQHRSNDRHGRARLLQNVASSWAGQLIVILTGFIVPRLIDRSMGQEALGVWDFGWSLISHFSLIQGGVVGSINRYVAQMRAQDDIEGLNRAVSSVTGLLRAMALGVILLTAAAVWAMPYLLRDSLAGHLGEARWLVTLLGASLAVQISAAVYGGVLTGCHRWDIHNAIHGATNLLNMASMITVLLLGYGLAGLAAANFASEAIGRISRVVIAHRVCSGLRISYRLMSWPTAREMVGFGGKMFVRDCASMLLNQTTSLLIVSHLGPGALALFARPTALIRNIGAFMQKYALVLVPTASSIASSGTAKEMRELSYSSARYAAYLSLPPFIYLSILGADILAIWMGPNYANGALMAILVASHFLSLSHQSLYYVLVGLNQHGAAGIANLAGAICSVSACYLALQFTDSSLIGCAIAIGVPWAAVHGVAIPIYASRAIGEPVWRLLFATWNRPLLYCMPYSAGLIAARAYGGSPATRLLLGLVAGALLIPPYWKYVVPVGLRTRISDRVSRVFFPRSEARS